MITGAEADRFLLASDAGYGFVVQFAQLQTKNKAGKAVLTLPKNARVLSPAVISQEADSLVVVATNEGRMLVFPLAELPSWPEERAINSLESLLPGQPLEKNLSQGCAWSPRAIRCG